jgi:hypothetical protein
LVRHDRNTVGEGLRWDAHRHQNGLGLIPSGPRPFALNTSGGCGTSVANAYCRDHGFKEAADYRKVEKDEINGAVPTIGSAVGDELFAIDCTR